MDKVVAQEDGYQSRDRLLITISVMLASTMQALDNTIANVALPRIQGSLSATQDQMTWVLTSYIIAGAIMTPLSGWLAGQIGRRRVFLFSVVGFTVASTLCGMAQSLPEIIAARVLQGLSGAALVPMSQAVLFDINPRERHARAMAIWAIGVTIGPILGPTLGGWLTEQYNWRWVFYINVPIGIMSFLGIVTTMTESRLRKSRFDFFGFTTLSIAIGALQLTLDRGQTEDWFNSVQICLTASIAGVAFYLFIVHMLTATERTFVSPALFKDRNFSVGSVFIFMMGIVLFAVLSLLPPMLQHLLNYPVLLTGLLTAPRGIGMLLAMVIVGRIMGKVDVRIIIGTGLCVTAFSLWQMTGFYLQMDSSLLAWSGLVQGVGVGFVYVPLAAVTFATLSPALRDEGTALFSLLRNFGSSVGIAGVAALLTRNTQIMHARLAEQITRYGSTAYSAAPVGLSSTHDLAMLNERVTNQAAMIAYNNDFKLMLIVTLCVTPLVLLLRDSLNGEDLKAAAIE